MGLGKGTSSEREGVVERRALEAAMEREEGVRRVRARERGVRGAI